MDGTLYPLVWAGDQKFLIDPESEGKGRGQFLKKKVFC